MIPRLIKLEEISKLETKFETIQERKYIAKAFNINDLETVS